MSQPQYSFKPCAPHVELVLFALTYGLGGGAATFFTFREISAQGNGLSVLVQEGALIALYLAGAYFLLLYVVFAPYRFRFENSSFSVFTWRGWRTFAWSQVVRADLSSYKGTVELVLFLGTVKRVSVPVRSFLQGATLLETIRARLGVPIAGSRAQFARVRDSRDGSPGDA